MNGYKSFAVLSISILLSGADSIGENRKIKIPAETKLYCELTERVISKEEYNQVGQKVNVRVWRDVIIDGVPVILAGTYIDAHISRLETAKFRGREGKLEITADSVQIIDGTEIRLEGGFGKNAKGQEAASIAFPGHGFLPLIFLSGPEEILEPGTLFDAYTVMAADVEISNEKAQRPMVSIDFSDTAMEVSVNYEFLEAQEIAKILGLDIKICGMKPPKKYQITEINDEPLEFPLKIKAGDYQDAGECKTTMLELKLKRIVKKFRPGINLFTLASEDSSNDEEHTSEVILDIQI